MAPRIELFAFRYRNPRTGKWIRARYIGTRDEIAQRHLHWEILGPAEVRDVNPAARYFTPRRNQLGNQVIVLASSLRIAIAGVAS